MNGEVVERLQIRELIENWAIWRDAGDWARFQTVWHDDGVMMATWFQGPAEEFIRATQEGWAKGVSILHFLGGTSIDLAGNRAIAADQDDDFAARRCPRRSLRRGLHGPLLRFHREARRPLGLVLRQPIYEKDRVDPVDPAATLVIDPRSSLSFRAATGTSRTSRPRSATT